MKISQQIASFLANMNFLTNECIIISDKVKSLSRKMLGVHCPMCLDPLSPEDDLMCPPCGHVFHYNCLVTWFDNKRASGGTPDCPQCRKVTDTENLLKIYLAAEAGIDQQENQESAELQCTLNEKLAEIEILRNYLTEFKVRNEQLVNTELRCQAEINLMKSKLKRSENETFKVRDKWFKERRMLQELEVKQGVLKKELREGFKKYEKGVFKMDFNLF